MALLVLQLAETSRRKEEAEDDCWRLVRCRDDVCVWSSALLLILAVAKAVMVVVVVVVGV
jgi:hypothetical protein